MSHSAAFHNYLVEFLSSVVWVGDTLIHYFDSNVDSNLCEFEGTQAVLPEPVSSPVRGITFSQV